MYRYGAKRFDPGSGTYDMGFRDYAPGLNRFTSRDSYNGALEDLNLGTDPFTSNRYAFTAGNPITRIELDGHCPMADEGGCDTHANYTGPTLPADDGTDDPTVTGHVGNRQVTAKDGVSYLNAYYAAKDKMVGTHGGQGTEYAIGCTSMQTTVIAHGEEHGCAWVDVLFAGQFAAEMCRQSGIECHYADQTGATDGLALGHDGGGIGRISGGPEEAPIGGTRINTGSGYCSFSGETRVLMADGTTKPISKIKVGDKVMATDPKTGKHGPRTVTRIWVHQDTVYDLEIGSGNIITTTEDHPFWNATHHRWERADQLNHGDSVLSADGHTTKVFGIRSHSARVTHAYNLTVDNVHTFYVIAGNITALVHNWQSPESVESPLK